MADFNQQIIEIISTAVLTTIGTITVTYITLRKSAANEAKIRRDELERHARFLAIRVVCKLDPFISECCAVVQDDGISDEEGITRPQASNPELTLPEDVDWKAIPPDLMYRILAFPNDLDDARQSVSFVGNEIHRLPITKNTTKKEQSSSAI